MRREGSKKRKERREKSQDGRGEEQNGERDFGAEATNHGED